MSDWQTTGMHRCITLFSGAINIVVRFNNYVGAGSRLQCFEGDIRRSLITSSTVAGLKASKAFVDVCPMSRGSSG